jgi:hypothetical protein
MQAQAASVMKRPALLWADNERFCKNLNRDPNYFNWGTLNAIKVLMAYLANSYFYDNPLHITEHEIFNSFFPYYTITKHAGVAG